MEKFRNLSKNIFFKIFLAFLGLTFITWGVGDFILSDRGSWVAKVGNSKITYQQFIKKLQSEKNIIYRSNPQEEVMKYLNSAEFKNNVLEDLITKKLISLLQKDLGVYPDENLILQQIAKSPNFQDSHGKFNRISFKNFLNRNNFTEKRYIDEVKNIIAATMIIGPLLDLNSSNQTRAEDFYKYEKETRMVDIVTVSIDNIDKVTAPNDFELRDFFEENKSEFILPQMRKVSYITFDKEYITDNISITQKEIESYYNDNIDLYKIPEKHNFYHLLFDDASKADEFSKALEQQSKNKDANIAEIFVKLTDEIAEQDTDSIYLENIAKSDLLEEIAPAAFALKKGQYSAVLQSPIGFHIFYLLDINPTSQTPLKQVQEEIKADLMIAGEEDILREKLSNIEDELLISNSLTIIANKFNFKINRIKKFDSKGLDARHNPIKEIQDLDQFTKNSFSLAAKEVSKLFYSKSNNQYYIIFVEEIDKTRQRSLDEVRVMVVDMWTKNKKQQELKKLAEDIAKKIKDQKGKIAKIAANNNLKLQKNRQLPRAYYIADIKNNSDFYLDDFLNNIFALNINEVSIPHPTNNNQYIIGVVRNIIIPNKNDKEITKLEQKLIETYKNDIFTQYNQYTRSKFPVKINDELLNSN